eukprot:TRINITY_DN1015_c0_g1_i7.p2 TRINITY_DN1015_c0_g1~~TRINITY_DN1015_c0_g1_i7.p2  ORF type:complete len:115 (-),score=23.29 TRINITY_DN1015_c0_g1_i7:665-1009(-)
MLDEMLEIEREDDSFVTVTQALLDLYVAVDEGLSRARMRKAIYNLMLGNDINIVMDKEETSYLEDTSGNRKFELSYPDQFTKLTNVNPFSSIVLLFNKRDSIRNYNIEIHLTKT